MSTSQRIGLHSTKRQKRLKSRTHDLHQHPNCSGLESGCRIPRARAWPLSRGSAGKLVVIGATLTRPTSPLAVEQPHRGRYAWSIPPLCRQPCVALLARLAMCVSRAIARKWRRIRGVTKIQGRRRSIPLAALSAPEIEIGLRLPAKRKLLPISALECDAVHKRAKKNA